MNRPKRITALLRPNAPTDWCRIATNQAADTAEIWLFDEIGYWGISAEQFVEQLRAITAANIDLHINSPGGEIFDGLAIHSCLKAHPAKVTTYVDGLAASAASFIAMAGDRIVINRNAMMMVHDASGLCWDNAAGMRTMADLLDKLSNNIADVYTQRAGGTVEEWRAVMLAETWYTGAEAVDAGLADEVSDPAPASDATPPEMANTWDLSIFRYAGREQAPAPAAVSRTAPAAPTPTASPAPQLVDLTSVPATAFDWSPTVTAPAAVTFLSAAEQPQPVVTVTTTMPIAPAEVVDQAADTEPADTPDDSTDTADTPTGDPSGTEVDDGGWAALVDHLNNDNENGWATHVAHLHTATTPTEDAFALAREALL